MALYIQHGHGKSDKIDTALAAGTVQGVIFGARNEKPGNLVTYLRSLRDGGYDCELLFDPQFYVSALVPPNDRYLPEYEYYTAGRTATDFTSARRIREYVKQTLDCQVDLGVDALISPTVVFDSFADRWHQISLNLADASLEYHGSLTEPPPLLLSFAFVEEALSATTDVNRFLDTVTQDQWNMDGLYLLVARNDSTYSQRFHTQRLANYMYIAYVLGQINGLRVVCGYTDFVGILLRAAGAEVFATGWSQTTLRRFCTKSFIKRKSGGQPARERYSSSPLYNSIFLGELQDVFDAGYLADVLSNVPLDSQITGAARPQAAGWTTAVSQQHHWQTLQAMDSALSGRVEPDLRSTARSLRDANALYAGLEAAGVQFERATGKDHLTEWTRAIVAFQRVAGLSAS